MKQQPAAAVPNANKLYEQWAVELIFERDPETRKIVNISPEKKKKIKSVYITDESAEILNSGMLSVETTNAMYYFKVDE